MRKKLLLTTATLWLSASAFASPVADFFDDLNTFYADFSQTVYQDGKQTQQSNGDVLLKKPLKFRWDYILPERMQLISDGERFYHYDAELAQATSKPISDVADTALATMLNDKNKIDETFTIAELSSDELQAKAPLYAGVWQQKAKTFYSLTPKQKNDDDGQAKLVILGISADDTLTVFYAEDAYGENIFLFDNVEQNQKIDDKEFQFNPPKDVDILGG